MHVRGDHGLGAGSGSVGVGRLGFADRLPAATTVWRLLIRIDAEVLRAVLTRWLRSRAVPVVVAGRRWWLVIAIDGKVQRDAPARRRASGPTKSRRSRRCWTGWPTSWDRWTTCCSSPTPYTPRPTTPSRPPSAAHTCWSRSKATATSETSRYVKTATKPGPATAGRVRHTPQHRHRIPPQQRQTQHRPRHQTSQPPPQRPRRCRDQQQPN